MAAKLVLGLAVALCVAQVAKSAEDDLAATFSRTLAVARQIATNTLAAGKVTRTSDAREEPVALSVLRMMEATVNDAVAFAGIDASDCRSEQGSMSEGLGRLLRDSNRCVRGKQRSAARDQSRNTRQVPTDLSAEAEAWLQTCSGATTLLDVIQCGLDGSFLLMDGVFDAVSNVIDGIEAWSEASPLLRSIGHSCSKAVLQERAAQFSKELQSNKACFRKHLRRQ